MIYYLFKCWHGIFLLQHYYNFIVIVIRQNIFLSFPQQISHTHKLFFPKFSFGSLAPSHSNYFLHLYPPKFFPLTLSLSQYIPKIFSPLSLSLGFSWSLSFSFSLSLTVISLSPLTPLLSFSPPSDPSAITTHCIATFLPPPPTT